MSQIESVDVLRRSPGRLRLHAPALSRDGGAGLARIAAAEGVLQVQLNQRTGNVLVGFDRALIDEPSVLALARAGDGVGAGAAAAAQSASRRSMKPSRRRSVEAEAPGGNSWRRAERTETIRARPAACLEALTDFDRYPEWQSYLTEVTVLQRDPRGRGVSVAVRAEVAERVLRFTTSYRFPSPNRIDFAQTEGELDAVRGSWAFRSSGSGRTRATLVIEVKTGRKLSLLLRGPLYEQAREAVLDHFMSELRERVEEEASSATEPRRRS